MRVDESIRLHGRRQIEFKQGLVLAPEDRACRYAVETYFFLPVALMIDPETYGSREFLRGLKNYVRLRPPKRPLSAYASGGEALQMLRRALERAPARRERALKRYGLGLRAAFKAEVQRFSDRNGPRDPAAMLAALEDALRVWRQEVLAVLPADVAATAVDEYLSVSASALGRRLMSALQIRGVDEKACRRAADFLRAETAYRLSRYPQTAATSDPEGALYRWRTLRKYVTNVLFLRPEVGEGNPWLRQSIYGAAAAFSMLFATLVAFAWQSKYGALSVNLFIALVVAYIFKDRLKDGLREGLAKVFRRWLPNRRTTLTRSDGQRAGRALETVDFLSADQVPGEVIAMRRAAHTLPFSDEYRESILRYRKVVEIDPSVISGEFGMRALYDITRIQVEAWTASIDTRFEELPYVDDEEDHAERRAEKRYHVYLVRVLETEDGRSADVQRIVLSEAGVIALEDVLQG